MVRRALAPATIGKTERGTARNCTLTGGLIETDTRRWEEEAYDWSSVKTSTGSLISVRALGSRSSDTEMVDNVGVASPKKYEGISASGWIFWSIGTVLATTATRETSAGAGRRWKARPADLGFSGSAVEVGALVRALTIGFKPKPPMLRCASVELRPVGVVATTELPSCSPCCPAPVGSSFERPACLLVRERPRCSRSSSLTSPPDRSSIALAQDMISSLLRDDDDETTRAAAGL